MFQHSFILITDDNKIISYLFKDFNKLSRQKLQPEKLLMSERDDFNDILKWISCGT